MRARLPGFGFSGFPDSRFLASVSWICLPIRLLDGNH
jgi:hypothetical protein